MDKKKYEEMLRSNKGNKWFGAVFFTIVLVLGIVVSFGVEYFLDQDDSMLYVLLALAGLFVVILVVMVVLSMKVPFVKQLLDSLNNKTSFGTIYRTKVIDYDQVIGMDYIYKLEVRLKENGYQEIARDGKLVLYKQSKLLNKHIMLIRMNTFNKDDLISLDRYIIDNHKKAVPLQVIIYTHESSEEVQDYLTYEIDTFEKKRAYILIDNTDKVICHKNMNSIEKNAQYVGKYDYKTIFGYSKKEL